MVTRKNSKEGVQRKVNSEPMFPAYLNELADAGITSYKANLSQGSLVYYGRGSGSVEDARKTEKLPGKTLVIRDTFNKELLKDAWRENNYTTFLSGIARAGVHSYKVDTSARTITYFGNGGSYTETVPQVVEG